MGKVTKDEAMALSWWHELGEEYATTYKGLEFHTKMTRAELKPIIASLKEKDYIRYIRGLVSEEEPGVGGSGWEVTRAGMDAYYERLEELEAAAGTNHKEGKE